MTAELMTGRQTRRLKKIVKTLHLSNLSVKWNLMHQGGIDCGDGLHRRPHRWHARKFPLFFERM